ncbi:MAG: hypothetical protein HKN33_07085 [Pyrinomonadaceae bacterium]|nr:hypothetical protein [Pyrinomonadaceae bacterium]
MGYKSDALRLAVSTLLQGSQTAKIKSFTFGGHKLTSGQLAHMGIEATHSHGKLNIKYKPSKKCFYKAKNNTLHFNFFWPGTLSQQALVIHESTHAVFDFKNAYMDIATSESIAFIAQCQFARANNPNSDPDVRLWDEGDKDEVFEVGWRIAGKLLDGGSISSSDKSDMLAAVGNHPTYHDEVGDIADYDGM